MTAPLFTPPKVTIVGAGSIGRGWAALCAAHGWPTVVFDLDARAADKTVAEIARRATALVSLGRADAALVAHGLHGIQVGRSLLHACGPADWIIESVAEDLALKQRLFENLGQVVRPDTVLTSSSSGLPITGIAARCREPGRCVVAHPLNPPEIIPLIEVVPGKFTAPQPVETLRRWLRALGRIPVTLKREVPGNAVGSNCEVFRAQCAAAQQRQKNSVHDPDS